MRRHVIPHIVSEKGNLDICLKCCDFGSLVLMRLVCTVYTSLYVASQRSGIMI
jgi:hypothetical protein